MTEQPRDQVGKSTRGRWETGPRTGNDVALTPERPRTGTEAILDAALARQRATDVEVTNATLSVVAQKVRQVCPGAVYLTLDEDHEYLEPVRSGQLLDKDFRVIEDDIAQVGARVDYRARGLFELTAAEQAHSEVNALLLNLRGLGSTDGCPAISDQFADDHAWAATGERRLHLATAAALFDAETEQADIEAVVAHALARAGRSGSPKEATQILTTALTSCLQSTPECAGMTGWRVDAVMDDATGMWAYDSTVAVQFDTADDNVEESFDQDRTPAGDLIYALTGNSPSHIVPPTLHWGTSHEEDQS